MANRYSVETIFKAVDRMTGPVSKMQKSIGTFTRKAENSFRSLDRAVTGFNRKLMSAGRTAVAGATIAVAGLTTGIGLLMREYSKVEDAEAAFTPLLGGAEKAAQLVARLNETAASTPFQFETLAGSAQQLLPVMNGDIENTIKTLRMLGDTAGGNAQKLDSVTRGFTKAMLKGKVDMESLNMIAEAGVPIFQDLAAVMGMDVGEKFFKRISAGKVTTDQLNKAFERMTGEGGKFFKGMEISSRTTSGLLSTLKDNISLTAAEIGGALAPTIKDIIRELTVVAQRVRTWVVANRELIGARFAEYVQLIRDNFVDVVTWLKRIGVALAVWVTFMSILKAFVLVMTAVNLVMALNPIGLIVLGIIAAIAAFSALVIWIDDVVAGFDKLPGVIKVILAPLYALLKGIKFVKDAFKGGLSFAAENFMASFKSDGDDSDGAPQPQTQMVTPQERTAAQINETRTTQENFVTIRDQTGRAEMGKPKRGGFIRIEPMGAF